MTRELRFKSQEDAEQAIDALLAVITAAPVARKGRTASTVERGSMTDRSLMEDRDRNVVSPEDAERNRTVGFPGRYTFHAVIPTDRVGKNGLTFAAVRVGEHAHVEVLSGRIRRRGTDIDASYDFAEPSYGHAGWLVLRWPEWVVLRDALAQGSPDVRVIEVEKPTAGQARRALSHEVRA